MRVELPNDITLQMEIDYGRIKIIQRCHNNSTIRYIICIRSNYGNKTKGGIKTRLERSRNSIQLHYDLKCPYFPKTYRDSGPINRHLYKIRCTYINENILFTEREQVWSDI